MGIHAGGLPALAEVSPREIDPSTVYEPQCRPMFYNGRACGNLRHRSSSVRRWVRVSTSEGWSIGVGGLAAGVSPEIDVRQPFAPSGTVAEGPRLPKRSPPGEPCRSSCHITGTAVEP